MRLVLAVQASHEWVLCLPAMCWQPCAAATPPPCCAPPPGSKRILRDRSGQLGVPHVETKAPTVPEPFALKTDQRAAEHSGGPHSSAAGSGGVFVFGAQGDDGGRVTRSRAAKKSTAGGSSWTGQLTQPEPFRLATDMRGCACLCCCRDTFLGF